MFKRSFELKESRGIIISDRAEAFGVVIESLKRNRDELEDYSRANPEFLSSLIPVEVPDKPIVANLMAAVSEKAEVGPMASVAGALADLAVRDMLDSGCQVAVVENGGEVAAFSNLPVDVGLAAGDEPLSRQFGFRLVDFPAGVATSSGRFSHAFSFGEADSATVFCESAALADAAATATGNVVRGVDFKAAVRCGVDRALSIAGVKGVLVMYRGFVGTGGRVPELIRLKAEPSHCFE